MDEVSYLCGEVFLGVEDDFVGSGGADEGGLLFGGDSGEDAGAAGFCHLDEEETDASGSGVDEDFVAGLNGVGGVREVVGGHALKDGGRGLLCGDAIGDGDETRSGGDGELGVGAGDGAPRYSVAGLDRRDVSAERDNGACGLLAESVGEMGGVAAFAEVGVDEVDAGGFDADEDFAGTGRGSGKIDDGEYVGDRRW